MIAGIVGDVIGSVYEGQQWNHKKLSLIWSDENKKDITPILKNLSFVRSNQSWTDDTLCSLALFDAYINKKDYATNLQTLCKKYQSDVIGFGKAFNGWVDDKIPYNSYGNGSIMRIGFIPNLNTSRQHKLKIGYDCTIISHNHTESITAVNDFITIAETLKSSQSKKVITDFLNLNQYQYTVEDLHKKCNFINSAKETLLQSLVIVNESNSIEEVLINSCYVGGDTDTIACIACNIASQLYATPEHLVEVAVNTLKPYDDLFSITEQYLSNTN